MFYGFIWLCAVLCNWAKTWENMVLPSVNYKDICFGVWSVPILFVHSELVESYFFLIQTFKSYITLAKSKKTLVYSWWTSARILLWAWLHYNKVCYVLVVIELFECKFFPLLIIMVRYCKPFFCGYLFLRFCLHGQFCSNIFSCTAQLDYASTMYSISKWTFSWRYISANFFFLTKMVKINR